MYVSKGIIFLFLFFSFFTSCGEIQTRGTVPVRLNLIFPAGQVVHGLSKGAPFETRVIPATLTLQVAGPGMEPISLLRDIPQNGEVIINMNIPAGLARRFAMTAFDAGGKPIFQGESALIDLHPGDLSVVVTIPFVSIAPPIQPIVPAPPIQPIVPAPPTVTLSVGLNTMNEASGTTTVTVALSATSSLLVTVTLTKGGTASETADYILDDAILIPAGALSASVTLTVVNDLLDENNETVVVDINTVTNSTESGVQQQTVAIIDNDDGAPPVANAGPDQNILIASLVTLDGSKSFDPDGNTLIHSWSFTTRPTGSSAIPSNPTAVNPTFTADRAGTYSAELIVNNGTKTSQADSVTIIATSTTVIATIPVELKPGLIAVNTSTNRIYVAHRDDAILGSDTVSIIDGVTNTVVTIILMADGISGIGVNPITHRIYVAHDLSIISVIDGMVGSPTENTVIATISVPGRDFPSIRGIAVDTTANRIYVPSFDPGGRVVVIDGLTNAVSQISVPSNPIITAINPTTNRIYVGHGSFFLRTQLTVIDGANNGVSDGAAVGLNQSGVGVNPDTNRIYVSKGDPSRDEPFAIVVVDGNTDAVLADIPVATAGPLGVNPTAKRLYVNGGDNNIFIIDISPGSPTENTIVANIAVGSAPFGIGVNPITNRIYVANTGSNTVSVIADFTAGSKVAGP